jgi:hypothetical protein
VGWLLDQPDLLPSPLADEPATRSAAGRCSGRCTRRPAHPDVDDTARLHRLIQVVALERLPDQEHHELVSRAVELLVASS